MNIHDFNDIYGKEDDCPMNQCQHAEDDCPCANEGLPCWLEDDDTTPDSWYCYEHSMEHGFCPGCGIFIPGAESSEFDPDLCPECQGDMEVEIEEDVFEAEIGGEG